MFRRSVFTQILALLFASSLPVVFESSIRAQNSVSALQPRAAVSILDSTKEQDGLVGSVRRVKIESAKIEAKEGRAVEGPRQLLELTTYSLKGDRIENISYPIPDSLVGKEEYKYDKRGNIIEMTLRDDNGTIINREAYSYDFDSFGNWTKMVTSLVLFENGEIKKEPVEVTYRTLTYYFDDNIAKIVNPSSTDRAPTDLSPIRPTLAEAVAPVKENLSVPTPAEFRPATFMLVKTNSRAFPKQVSANSLEAAGDPPLIAGAESKKSRLIAVLKPNIHESNASRSLTKNDDAETPTGTDVSDSKSSSRLKGRMNESNDGSSDASNPADDSSGPPVAVRPPMIDSASEVNQKTANDYYRLGLAQYASGDLRAAISSYQESIRLEPRSAEVYLNLGIAYLKLEKDHEAAKALNESVKLDPQSAEAHYGLGLISFRMHRFRDAADSFKKATTISPDMAKAHYGLSLAYEELNDESSVLKEFRILERLDKELAKKLMRTFPQIPFTCRVCQD